MPLPTIMTWAGSCPDPDPWMIDTLSSLGASVRMMRLYSGTYLRVSGLASAMPLSISGTNCWGSLTNFFICHYLRFCGPVVSVPPLIGKCFEHHCDGDCASVERADAALAGIAGPSPHGLHGPGGLGPFARGVSGRPKRGYRVVAQADPLLERVDGRHDRIEQGLVANVGAAASLDAVGRSAKHRHDLVGWKLGYGTRGRAGPQEGGAPDRARGPADTAGDDDGDLLQERADVGPVEAVPVLQDQLETASHRV